MLHQNQTPEEPIEVEGPIEIHFTDTGAMKVAEGLPINPQKRFATVPKEAKVSLRSQGISVQYNGTGYSWSLHSVRAVLKDGKQIQRW